MADALVADAPVADAPVAATRHLIMDLPSQSSGFRSPFEFKAPATCHPGLPPAT